MVPIMANHQPVSWDAVGLRFLFFKDKIWGGGKAWCGELMLGSSYKGIKMESEAMQTRWNYTSQRVYS